MRHTNPSHYIDEIDTLRAVAVMLVVLFHAAPRTFSGGFVGVDMFFVVSGFVISRSYLFPLIHGERTLTEFYLARVRRLAPALIVCLGLTAASAMMIMLPDRVIAFGWSLLVQPQFLQNLVFWNEGGYFSTALNKPLLHTWSLAVEEQFYIGFAIAILMFRRLRWLLVPAITLMILVSIAAGAIVETRSPKTAFFHFPFRAWEFALGIGAHLLSQRVGELQARLLQFVPYVCIAVVVYCGIAFDRAAVFPGIQSVLTCFATAIALFLFDRSRLSSPGLGLAPLTYVGRISYGFYLWHWPPISLFFLYAGRAATSLEAGILVLVAFVGAVATYHWIEQPIRQRQWFPTTRGLLLAGGLSSGLIVVAALSIFATGGLLNTFPDDIRAYLSAGPHSSQFRCGKVFTALNPGAEICPIGTLTAKGGVLVHGDSHANVVKEVIGELANSAGVSAQLTARNCMLGEYGTTRFCSHSVRDAVVEQARAMGIKDVFAIASWNTGEITRDRAQRDFGAFIAAGMTVHVMEKVPTDPSYDPRQRAKTALNGGALDATGIRQTTYLERIGDERQLLERLQQKYPERIRLYSLQPIFCPETACRYVKGGKPLYFDGRHVSKEGAEELRPLFSRMLEDALRPR
ncbi:MAG: acyltransferase family protein [Pseudomonadota bacterium]